MPSSVKTELAVVLIANWNGRQHLNRCLTALFAQRCGGFQAVLIDNGSTDGSSAWVTDHFPQVQLLQLAENVGFARANNLGITSTSSRYVVTLNNDTEVEPGWLETLIGAAEADATIGACASRIVLADRPDRLDSAGLSVDRFGFAWQRGHGELDQGRYRKPADVWGASAAAALYRRDMLDRIGLFDEEFESYYEDVDLAWRARRAGWRCRYVPDRCVRHVHSATGGRDPDRKLFLLTRNRWWTIARNYPLSRLWWMWPLLGLADLLSLARGLIRQRNGGPLTARLAALQGLPHVWRTRPTH
jgi:GT2 family glycosyltransferase